MRADSLRPLRAVPLLAAMALISTAAGRAQPPAASASAPGDPVARIIAEERAHSHIAETVQILSDEFRARLTGSPALARAEDWVQDRLGQWGLANARLEPWGSFGRGWTLVGWSAEMVAPERQPLAILPKAWSPGTRGAVVGDAVWLDAPDLASLEKYKGKLRGKVVMLDPPIEVRPHLEPAATRMSDAELLARANASAPIIRPPNRSDDPATIAWRNRRLFSLQKLAFLKEEGAALLVNTSRRDGGILDAEPADVPWPFDPAVPQTIVLRSAQPYDRGAAAIPQVVMAVEDYNRILRLLAGGASIRLAIEIAARWSDGDGVERNVIAEIPGGDKADEVVMLGAHLDSWHGGGGATDNAAGVAVMMEAARILEALNLKPRRTIRIALWTGEEEGALGSRAYVRTHFGEGIEGDRRDAGNTVIHPTSLAEVRRKPDYEKFDAYFNLDAGSGKIRGVDLQGIESARPIFREWLKPFRTIGAETLSIEGAYGSDHESFSEIGLPAFQFIQDRLDYFTVTHHSNQDVFDRVRVEDLKQAAIIVAAFAYQTAMRDRRLPRAAAFEEQAR